MLGIRCEYDDNNEMKSFLNPDNSCFKNKHFFTAIISIIGATMMILIGFIYNSLVTGIFLNFENPLSMPSNQFNMIFHILRTIMIIFFLAIPKVF